jgi:hypothetical protein
MIGLIITAAQIIILMTRMIAQISKTFQKYRELNPGGAGHWVHAHKHLLLNKFTWDAPARECGIIVL